MAHTRFSLFRLRSPLLTESLLFSLPMGTEMFHFPTLSLSTLCVQIEMMEHNFHRVPPFGNPRIKALLAAPRGFSQPHTTFLDSWCLGICHLHLLIYSTSLKKLEKFHKAFRFLSFKINSWGIYFLQRCSRSLCSSQVTDDYPKALKKFSSSFWLLKVRTFRAQQCAN